MAVTANRAKAEFRVSALGDRNFRLEARIAPDSDEKTLLLPFYEGVADSGGWRVFEGDGRELHYEGPCRERREPVVGADGDWMRVSKEWTVVRDLVSLRWWAMGDREDHVVSYRGSELVSELPSAGVKSARKS
jgi:hypothetical protein